MATKFIYISNWREEYKKKLATADEAVKCIKSNSLILSAGEGGESDFILNALAKRKDQLVNVEIHLCNSRNYLALNEPEYGGHFIADNWFVSSLTRAALHSGQGTFTPSNFSQYAENIKRSKWGSAETAILQVSPPDKHGS